MKPVKPMTKAMSPFVWTQHRLGANGVVCGVRTTAYWWLWYDRSCNKLVRRKCKRCYR